MRIGFTMLVRVVVYADACGFSKLFVGMLCITALV